MLKIGLTGGIASGKSTISKMIRSYSIPIVDADVCAREVVEPGEDAYNKIVKTFGDEILNADSKINRKRLGEIVFHNEDKRKQLNAIVHPEVRKRMLKKMDECEATGVKACVLDIPLLIESKLMNWVDKVIVVYVPRQIQLDRLMERDQVGKEAAFSRINAQIPLDEKKQYADAVIDNSGTIEDTKKQLNAILKEWGLID